MKKMCISRAFQRELSQSFGFKRFLGNLMIYLRPNRRSVATTPF